MARNAGFQLFVVLVGWAPATLTLASESNVAPAERSQSAYSPDQAARDTQNVIRARSQPSTTSGSPFVYDRRRAANSIREIADHVKQMAQRSKVSAGDPVFDPARAQQTLQTVKTHVSEMQKRTRNKQRTVAGPIGGMRVHRYHQVRVPTPQRIDEPSGLTHQQLAESRLLNKGYRKTDAGWLPPKRQTNVSQRQPEGRLRVSRAAEVDPF